MYLRIVPLKDGRHPPFAEGCLKRLISLYFQSTLGGLRKLWGGKAESLQLALELGGFQRAWELSSTAAAQVRTKEVAGAPLPSITDVVHVSTHRSLFFLRAA